MPREGAGCAIRAVVRIRPLLQHESDRGDRVCCEVSDANNMMIQTAPGNQWRQYAFDACLPMDCSQKQAFQESGVANLLDSAMMGFSATVLAYGQTGSGKTYTMVGRLGDQQRGADKNEDGLVVRTAKRLFRLLANGALQEGEKCTVSASFTEIFNAPGAVNECICDLLNPEAKNLQVRHNKKHGFFVSDLCVVDCESAADVRQVLEEGVRSRRVASHALNKDSSRSHALFTLHIDVETPPDSPGGQPVRRYGKLTFVDLAGSERLKESAAEGHTLKETQAINKSLFTLGQVISMLSSGKAAQHVPYRNSKLTQLLQESFGGESMCLMVTCISPAMSFAEESVNSLRYATKAMNIRNMPVVRLDERQQLVHDLRAENLQLKRELSVYKDVYGSISPGGGGNEATILSASPVSMGRGVSATAAEEPWKAPTAAAGADGEETPDTHRSVRTPVAPEVPMDRQGSGQSQASSTGRKQKRNSVASGAKAEGIQPRQGSAGRKAAAGGRPSPSIGEHDEVDMQHLRRAAGLGEPSPLDLDEAGPLRGPAEGGGAQEAFAKKNSSKPPLGPAAGRGRNPSKRGRSEPPPEASRPSAPPKPCAPTPPPAVVPVRADSRGRASSYAAAAAKRRQVQEQKARPPPAGGGAARSTARSGSGSKPASLPPLPGRSPSSASLDMLSGQSHSVRSRPSSAAGSQYGSSVMSDHGALGPAKHGFLAPLAEAPVPENSDLDGLLPLDQIGSELDRKPALGQQLQQELQDRSPLPRLRNSSQVPTISAPPSTQQVRRNEVAAAAAAVASAGSPAVMSARQSTGHAESRNSFHQRSATTEMEGEEDFAPVGTQSRPAVSAELVQTQLRHLDRLPWAEWQFKFDKGHQADNAGNVATNAVTPNRGGESTPRGLPGLPPKVESRIGSRRSSIQPESSRRSSRRSSREGERVQTPLSSRSSGSGSASTGSSAGSEGMAACEQDVRVDSFEPLPYVAPPEAAREGRDSVLGQAKAAEILAPPRMQTVAASAASTASGTPPTFAAMEALSMPQRHEDSALVELSAKLSSMQHATSALNRKVVRSPSPVA
mmetsp:Transcript_7902/g.17453  ORF Transcript_7902/g.17453 Transcript_7902/m.17453 type:complete len:1067 (-) Transcript_7902:40-3240(-)